MISPSQAGMIADDILAQARADSAAGRSAAPRPVPPLYSTKEVMALDPALRAGVIQRARRVAMTDWLVWLGYAACILVAAAVGYFSRQAHTSVPVIAALTGFTFRCWRARVAARLIAADLLAKG